MKKNNKHGFTLVELLAVIAVLGLVLIIAVPKITKTMESSKKKTLVLTAKSIARSAEEQYLENEINGIEEEITCESVSDYSSDDFSSCAITFDEEGKAFVTLEGKGSYKGLNICNGTKIEAKAINISCSEACWGDEVKKIYHVGSYEVNDIPSCVSVVTERLNAVGETSFVPAVEPICNGQEIEGTNFHSAILMMLDGGIFTEEELIENKIIKSREEVKVCVPSKATSAATYIKSIIKNENSKEVFGLIKDNTADENIRYSGGNEVVRNYVEFGNTNELWRIIGVFEMKTASGKTEELVKIVREDSIGNIAWDESDSTINNGNGINQWGESGSYEGADLMRILNRNYLNKQNVENACATDGVFYELVTCNFSSTGMSSIYKSMIETVVWNTGALNIEKEDLENYNLNTVNLYNAERGTVGKLCSAIDSSGNANSDCNDTVTRTSTWEGLVALPYGSDYAYATSEVACHINMWTGLDENTYTTTCKNNNWMHYGATVIDDSTWYLSTNADSTRAWGSITSWGTGLVNVSYTNSYARVRPTVYLKSSVQITGGEGTYINPYKLS